jgi:pantothenate kinase
LTASEIAYYTFSVNNLEIQAGYFQEDVNEIFLPLVQTLTNLQKQQNRRIIVFLAAPPATGKTTLSLFLEYLSVNTKGFTPIQSIGLDGFHFPQKYLETHSVLIDGKDVPMKAVKGAPETFDLQKVLDKIRTLQSCENVQFPVYSRILHDVEEDKKLINGKIILIEGNWLLLDEDGWQELKQLCDYSIFIHAKEEMLETRLIQRKIRGGLSEKEAQEFYIHSDAKNVNRVLNNKLKSDLFVTLQETGKFLQGELSE